MKLIKEIKTDFGKSVKYYEIPMTNGAAKYGYDFQSGKHVNACILKITDYRGNITEEKFYASIYGEYDTNLEVHRYKRVYTSAIPYGSNN